MNCEEARDQIDAYAIGALDPEDAAALDVHLAGCEACSRALDEARDVAGMLALAAPLRRPSPSLRGRVLAQAIASPAGAVLAQEAASPERAPAAPISVRASRWAGGGRFTLAAAVAALAVGIGGLAMSAALLGRVDDLDGRNDALQSDNASLARDLAGMRETAQRVSALAGMSDDLARQQAALAIMTAPDAARIRLDTNDPTMGAAAYYYWSRSSNMGVLVASNLSPPLQGRTYRMWLARGSQVDDVGELKVHPNRTAIELVQLVPGEPVTGMALTIEPERTFPKQPSGTILLATASNTPEPAR